MPRRLLLKVMLSPGDVCTLTAAIESLHGTYPGEYVTDVETSCDAIFQHNPRITQMPDADVETIELHYDRLLQRCNNAPASFLAGYCDNLGTQLGIRLELTTNRPHIYLSDEEKSWMNQVQEHFTKRPTKFWLINAGTKRDFTLKQWPIEYYQEVVDHFRGAIQFVQVGSAEHDHPVLENVISLLGKTDARQLIRLAYHAQGGMGPITFLQHLCAAFEKPYVALLGGRESASWVQYPLQTTLHTLGKLPCCRTASCWRSRVLPLDDGSEQDRSLCDYPVLGMRKPVGKCMAILRPIEAIRAIEAWYDGGALSY